MTTTTYRVFVEGDETMWIDAATRDQAADLYVRGGDWTSDDDDRDELTLDVVVEADDHQTTHCRTVAAR